MVIHFDKICKFVFRYVNACQKLKYSYLKSIITASGKHIKFHLDKKGISFEAATLSSSQKIYIIK